MKEQVFDFKKALEDLKEGILFSKKEEELRKIKNQ